MAFPANTHVPTTSASPDYATLPPPPPYWVVVAAAPSDFRAPPPVYFHSAPVGSTPIYDCNRPAPSSVDNGRTQRAPSVDSFWDRTASSVVNQYRHRTALAGYSHFLSTSRHPKRDCMCRTILCLTAIVVICFVLFGLPSLVKPVYDE